LLFLSNQQIKVGFQSKEEHKVTPFQSSKYAFRTLVWRGAFVCFTIVVLFLLTACDGRRSALDPAGDAAERVANLYWWMVGGSIVILLLVIGLTIYAIRARRQPDNDRKANMLIVVGGVVWPTVVLTALLMYGLAMLPDFTAPAPANSLKITIHGKQWWWRVRYESAAGQWVELANEIRLPVNEPVEFRLESYDVNHSFWIPSLGGKLDLIPGRVTRLTLKPTRTGVFQGVCAEYCGLSHAFMQFPVVILEKSEFEQWLTHQAQAAAQPTDAQVARGQELFFANACNTCHTIRGGALPALSAIGPDLTHVGSRLNIAAGTLPNEVETLARWVANTHAIKPGTLMPAFANLPPEDLRALAVYLKSLQ
jgi:cytochrome c oxidase subunit II